MTIELDHVGVLWSNEWFTNKTRLDTQYPPTDLLDHSNNNVNGNRFIMSHRAKKD